MPDGELTFKERLARIEALQAGSRKKKDDSATPSAPVRVEKPAEVRGQ